jgi:hypothetical protein
MLNLFDKTRCKRCHNERQVRKCPRLDKNLCWECCNSLRYDLSCPTSCPYSGKQEDSAKAPFPAFKADSQTESRNVNSLYIDIWLDKKQDALGGISPRLAATEDKKKLLDWLSSYQYPPQFPIDYLMTKLHLELASSTPISDPEVLVNRFMEAVIALDWQQLPAHSINTNPPAGCSERQIELLSSIPVLKRISTFKIIHSGTTEDGQTALVFLEINHRNDLSLVLSLRDKTWLIRQVILGSPKDFFLQNERYRAIAESLAKPDDAKAWDLLQEAFRIYPDSPDLYYYRGLYWQLVKETGKAKVDFFNSISLDNGFVPSFYHLALLNASDREYDEAILWFELLDKLQPKDPQNMNNLAACYAQTGQKSKAKTLWEEALKIQPGFEAARLNLEKLSAI